MAFQDNFDGESSEVVLTAHTPSNGTAWTFVSGLSDAMKVTTDGYVRPSRSTRSMFWCDNQGSAQQYVKIDTVNLNPANDTGICLRAQDIDNYWGVRFQGLVTDASAIYKVNAGVVTVEDSFTAANGKEYVVEAVGNTITVYENGAEVASVTDAFNNSENRAGLIANANSTNYVLDNFEHGAGTYQSSSLEAQESGVSGAGAITRNGTGSIEAQASAVYGISGANQTGSGALEAQASSMSGTGQTGSSDFIFLGLVQLAAGNAQISGTGSLVGETTGTGTLQAQEPSLDGATLLTRVGTGALESAVAQLSGAGVIADITADGTLLAQAATIAGVGARVQNISSSLAVLRAGSSTIDGDGYRATIIYGNDTYDIWTKIN